MQALKTNIAFIYLYICIRRLFPSYIYYEIRHLLYFQVVCMSIRTLHDEGKNRSNTAQLNERQAAQSQWLQDDVSICSFLWSVSII